MQIKSVQNRANTLVIMCHTLFSVKIKHQSSKSRLLQHWTSYMNFSLSSLISLKQLVPQWHLKNLIAAHKTKTICMAWHHKTTGKICRYFVRWTFQLTILCITWKAVTVTTTVVVWRWDGICLAVVQWSLLAVSLLWINTVKCDMCVCVTQICCFCHVWTEWRCGSSHLQSVMQRLCVNAPSISAFLQSHEPRAWGRGEQGERKTCHTSNSITSH